MIIRITLVADDLEVLKQGRAVTKNIRGQLVEIELWSFRQLDEIDKLLEEANRPEGEKT